MFSFIYVLLLPPCSLLFMYYILLLSHTFVPNLFAVAVPMFSFWLFFSLCVSAYQHFSFGYSTSLILNAVSLLKNRFGTFYPLIYFTQKNAPLESSRAQRLDNARITLFTI